MPPQETNENSAGPVIAIIIVLAMIILGGLYFWGERNNGMSEYKSENSSESTESITTQSSSDDTSSIEADLNETDVEDLGAELDTI